VAVAGTFDSEFRIQDMLPGPVFNIELLTTARRARYYAIRFAYGIMLLFFVVQMVGIWRGEGQGLWAGGELSISQMAATGQSIFGTLTVFQGVAVLVITPALVAGVVADEKQRKTLQYLLVSRLTSTEIILGKLFARLLHVGIFLAIGLPVTSLISLFGGVEPLMVLLSYALTLSTASFLAALAVLVSTLARRPREASMQVYILELAWLVGPQMIARLMALRRASWLDPLYGWIRPVNGLLLQSSPLALMDPSTSIDPIHKALGIIGLQLTFALVFVLLAIVALRRLARRDGGASGRVHRFLPRPAVSDDPMLWKEKYAPRSRGLIKLVIAVVYAIVVAIVIYTTFVAAVPAFVELWYRGYSAAEVYADREVFNVYLRTVCTLVYVGWCLAVASVAAAAVVGEREGDTWTSLITTPMSGEEILRAKMFGAVWGTRWYGLPLLVLWLLGLASGAVHPIGFAAVVIETAVFLWFVAALGVSLSLTAKSSTRALTATLAILAGLNGFYLLCCIPLHPDTIFSAAGVTPMIEWISLLSYHSISWFYTNRDSAYETKALLTCLVGLVLYAAGALYLTTDAFVSFDAKVDRPRRGREPTEMIGQEEGSAPPAP
jgi:ABC-type transport system involved in multi-copper enzyme maturation permease subunit